jgi:hypothetical protein
MQKEMLYGYELTEEKPTWFKIEEELRGENMIIPCLDHAKFGTNGDEVVLLLEPYNVSMEDIKDLIKFCQTRNLEFEIWGSSFHNPGNTLGICVRCKDKYKKKGSQFWLDRYKYIMEDEEFDEFQKYVLRDFQERWA